MQTIPVSVLTPATRVRTRTALVASADRSFRQRTLPRTDRPPPILGPNVKRGPLV